MSAADVIHDPVTDWCACEPLGDDRCDYRLLADAVVAKLNPRDGDEAEVSLCITAVNRAAASVAELLELLGEMLATFIKTSDGHRARVGQLQIRRWKEQIQRIKQREVGDG